MNSGELRVAMLAGTLGLGGAEKQLFLMARALRTLGISPVVFSLTKGEYYEQKLLEHNIRVEYVGDSSKRIRRLFSVKDALVSFQPHIIQSTHFYTNLYTMFASHFCNAVGIGAIRSDTILDQKEIGIWGGASLYLPHALIVNSHNARENAIRLGVKEEKIYLLENVIDLVEFDQFATQPISLTANCEGFLAVAVAGLAPVKRLERFITALSILWDKKIALNVKGAIVGDGPELNHLKLFAQSKGLDGNTLFFLGSQSNIPALLKKANVLVLTSDREGFPNVLLEAMAAGLPVISTPAGDATRIIVNGSTGYIVDFDDVFGLAEKITFLAKSPRLRQIMGEAGRKRVEQVYPFPALAEKMLRIYKQIYKFQKHQEPISIIEEIYKGMVHNSEK